jgi:hypothetical protein
MAHGIDKRHARGCRSREGGRCSCRPSARARRAAREMFPEAGAIAAKALGSNAVALVELDGLVRTVSYTDWDRSS